MIRDQWYQTTELSDSHSLVMGELVVREDSEEGILYDMCFRFTVVLEKARERVESSTYSLSLLPIQSNE